MVEEETTKSRLHSFHEDEEGVEALEAVLLIGLAAIILFFISKVAMWAIGWTSDKAQELKD